MCDNLAGGVDYGSGPYNVRFSVGNYTVYFCVNITDDNLHERDEIFGLKINTTSLPSRVISKDDTTNVTIVDNECKYVNYMYDSSVTYILTVCQFATAVKPQVKRQV